MKQPQQNQNKRSGDISNNNVTESLEEAVQQQQQQNIGQSQNQNNDNDNIIRKQTITPELRNQILEMSAKLEEKSRANMESHFIKIDDGQKRTFRVLPRMPEEKQVVYDKNKPNETVTKYRFFVYEQVLDEKTGIFRDMTDEPKEYTAPVTVCRELLRWMEKGIFLVEITRNGTGLGTKYTVDPVI
jgi:hypothetical protein